MGPNINNHCIRASSSGIESLTAILRCTPERFIACLHVLRGSKTHPSLCDDRNGDGYRYTRLFAVTASGHQVAWYLGRLTVSERQLLECLLDLLWPEQRREWQIQSLRQYRREIAQFIRRVAPKCGFRLHGNEMRIRRMRK